MVGMGGRGSNGREEWEGEGEVGKGREGGKGRKGEREGEGRKEEKGGGKKSLLANKYLRLHI